MHVTIVLCLDWTFEEEKLYVFTSVLYNVDSYMNVVMYIIFYSATRLRIYMKLSILLFLFVLRGSMPEQLEKELVIRMIFPTSRNEDSIIIEGASPDSVARAAERIRPIIDEAVKSSTLDNTRFISLHPQLVDKLVNFQNTISRLLLYPVTLLCLTLPTKSCTWRAAKKMSRFLGFDYITFLSTR
ncbi:hypothetical protein CTI12_AA121420 [Artemisia annua]|uniref:Uncharacterized protein n=2 Tax=Artemisia annua TaxID=35608 RepID=A0A2U1PRF0_ARTAN|nr:hypothetical protein CTI12_AA121420 [Artemisia annua]